jgi:hypothetical protein
MESVKFSNDSLFNKVLSLCIDRDDKTAAWFIYSYPGLEAEGIKNIYYIDPTSDYIDVLLSRIINKYEKEIQQADLIFKDSLNNQEKNEANDILNLIAQFSNKAQLKRRNLWFAAEGYIYALLRNKDSADVYFNKAETISKHEEARFQINLKVLETVSTIINVKVLNALTENLILNELNWFEKNKIEPEWRDTSNIDASYSFIKKILIYKYSYQNEFIKKSLLIDENLHYKPDEYTAKEIYNFMKRKDLSDYDKYLIKNYNYNLDQLGNIIGTNFIYRHDFASAVDFLEHVLTQDSLLADPFSISINDSTSNTNSMRVLSKLDFARQMLLYKKYADINNKSSAKYDYLLANAYYNTSYYGNSWNAATYYLTVDKSYYIDKGNTDFFDCTTAQEYYTKAMNETEDKEFAAMCCFMASKCEQNKFYDQAYIDSLYTFNMKIKYKYRNYFRLLKNNYSDTKFYKTAIDECKYFNEFVKNN